MNLRSTGILAIAALVLTTTALTDADAARLGGGKSFGAQRPSVAPRAATPPATTPPAAASQPVMPATPGATLPAKPVPAAAPSGASRWLGPIAGLAAGLGLAALLSHFGLPEGFGSFLLIALLVIGGVFVVRMLLARRSAPTQRPLAYAGTQGPAAAPAAFEMPPAPQWGGAPRVEPVLAPSAAAPARRVPAGFDADGFLRHAKLQFIRLQAAHDVRDRAALADVMTPEMFAEVARDLDGGAAPPPTEVVTLEADLLEVETEGDRHWASVRFTGTLREGAGGPATSFDEIWNLTKPADGSSGWLLAGIQQPA
jgi:predicted lipid-binding transport protein (Tim44 family)